MPVEDPFADTGPHAVPTIPVIYKDDNVSMPKHVNHYRIFGYHLTFILVQTRTYSGVPF
jgi:hypothetical protein